MTSMTEMIFIVVLASVLLIAEAKPQEDNSGISRIAVQEYEVLGRDLANSYRAIHNSAPLKLNETLNKAAQSYAEYLIQTNSFTNKLEPGFIKNLYSFKYKGFEIDENKVVENAIKSWYESKKNYNWNSPGISPFSALVWKSTTDLGIGVASKGNRKIVVAAFSPEGNLLGEDGKYFKENVFRSNSE